VVIAGAIPRIRVPKPGNCTSNPWARFVAAKDRVGEPTDGRPRQHGEDVGMEERGEAGQQEDQNDHRRGGDAQALTDNEQQRGHRVDLQQARQQREEIGHRAEHAAAAEERPGRDCQDEHHHTTLRTKK
jgi:hypothetical protein